MRRSHPKPATVEAWLDPRLHLAALRLWSEAAETAFYSSLTIHARLQQMGMAMATGRDMPVAEMTRMTTEKSLAALQSLIAAWHANARFATDPHLVLKAMSAALLPYTRKSRSNARRLHR